MSGSAELARRLKNPKILIDGSGPLGGWEDAYMVNGGHRECGANFIATPVGPDPNGFLICQRKKSHYTGAGYDNILDEYAPGIPLPGLVPYSQKYSRVNPRSMFSDEVDLNTEDPNGNFPEFEGKKKNLGVTGTKIGACGMYYQSYDLYGDKPNQVPRYSQPSGQALALHQRRPPYQAHLQGADYYRDPIRYRGIGTENLDAIPGQFGYQENKYYNSAPPPKFDITQGVQPYPLWRREMLRSGLYNEKSMQEFDKQHTYKQYAATF
jgi:hypothetical protein